jgi:hypothetical protein
MPIKVIRGAGHASEALASEAGCRKIPVLASRLVGFFRLYSAKQESERKRKPAIFLAGRAYPRSGTVDAEQRGHMPRVSRMEEVIPMV